MQKQVFWYFQLNKLLKAVLFGIGFEKIHNNYELVYKTKKEVVIHIASMQRMRDIFSLNGLEPCHQERRGMMYACSAKVSLLNRSGQSIIDYVTKEDNDNLFVLLDNGKNVCIRCPQFDKKVDYNVYDVHGSESGYSISQYWPIRFKFNASGASYFTLNRVVRRKKLFNKH